MALPTAIAIQPTTIPRDQKDPAYAGKYGYRALGAYSSGVDSGVNTAYNPTASSSSLPAAPAAGVGGVDFGPAEDAVKQAVLDPLKMPNRIVDKAVQGVNTILDHGIQGTGRIIDRGIQSAGQKVNNAAQTLGRLPTSPVSTVNKIIGTNTVICTELHRQGRVGDKELRLARVFRSKYLPSEHLYTGYLIWATPVVKWMRSSKVFNRVAMPFAMALVHQWGNVVMRRPGTLLQRAVYRLAWGASSLAYHIEKWRRDRAVYLECR